MNALNDGMPEHVACCTSLLCWPFAQHPSGAPKSSSSLFIVVHHTGSSAISPHQHSSGWKMGRVEEWALVAHVGQFIEQRSSESEKHPRQLPRLFKLILDTFESHTRPCESAEGLLGCPGARLENAPECRVLFWEQGKASSSSLDLMAAPAGVSAPPGLLGNVVRTDRGWQASLPSPGGQLIIGVFSSRQLATVALDVLRLGSGLSTGLGARQVPLEYTAEVSGRMGVDASESAATSRAWTPSNDDRTLPALTPKLPLASVHAFHGTFAAIEARFKARARRLHHRRPALLPTPDPARLSPACASRTTWTTRRLRSCASTACLRLWRQCAGEGSHA